MLVERPFLTEYAFAQQGSYVINQHIIGLQQVMMGKKNQFSTVNDWGYHRVSAEKIQARQPALGCNGTLSYKPINSVRTSYVSGRPTSDGFCEPKRDREVKQEVFAFGPKHAEHARRYYQSKRAKSQFEQALVAPCRANYGPIQIQYEQMQGGGCLSGEPISSMNKRPTLYPYKLNGPKPFATSEPYETVVKVANISPRPDKKLANKPKPSFCVLENGHHEKVDGVTEKKSIDFLDNKNEIDLSNAPIFQILCEISKM